MAVFFGLSLVTLLVLAGGGLDLARSINQKTQMQGAVDAAALAGAGAYTTASASTTAQAVAKTYMDNFKATSGITSLTYTITPGTTTSGATVSAYTMKVTATSTIANTLMTIAKASNDLGVSSIAQNPVYNITLAWSLPYGIDTNSISYYTVPADGSIPATTPIATNNGTNSVSGTLQIPTTGSQKIGFMLINTTDGNSAIVCTGFLIFQTCKSNDYGSNQYAGTSKLVHYFYSHLSPPSKSAYPGVTQNCSLQVTTTTGAVATTGCTSSLPAYSTINCAQASGLTIKHWWNDMGGATDGKTFGDAVYTVTCSQVGSTAIKGLVLTN
ncbi:MAG: pilus assembly protein TadG-related protein [Janthinobacterium lividum]